MYQKDFNLILSEISNKIKSINQLLYQCLVLIIFYYIFNKLPLIINTHKNKNKNSLLNISTHKSFIYLIFILCVILDWFIWNNSIQTSLFISILIIYIMYNINKSSTISTFISIINDSKDINKINIQNENILNDIKIIQDLQKTKEQKELEMITFIPKDIDFSNPKNNPNYNPSAYEKKLDGINDLNSAYSSNIPSLHITDSKYADTQLHNLYESPQYKNINKISNDIKLNSGLGSFNEKNKNNDTNNDMSNSDLFRNPKRDFLDNKWLSLKENTYNDNCKNCKSNNVNNVNNVNNTNKNAICSVVKYGQELEECTNQTNTITNKQLDRISSNKIEPIYKM